MTNTLKNLHSKLGWLIYPFLTIFGLGVILIIFPYSFIPDFIGLSDFSKPFELFNLIISSLVTLIGIYVSVSLVAYEFFRQKSGIEFQKMFLISQLNAYFISFTICTIIWVFVVSLVFPLALPNNSDITIIYYTSILFLVIILGFIPVAFNLFASLKPNKIADDELSRLTGETIFVAGLRSNDIDEQVELLENDPILKVTNIVIALISVSDYVKAQAIIYKASQKILEILIAEKSHENKKYISDRLISLYIRIVDFAIPLPNGDRMLESIWNNIGNLYGTISEKNLSTEHLSNFREKFFNRFLSRLFEFNKEEQIIKGVESISSIIKNQVLQNLPEDESIYAFNHFREKNERDFSYPKQYTKDDHNNTSKWKEVGVELVDLYSLVINKSIANNRALVLDSCFSEINKLNLSFHSTKIGVYKQFFFFINTSIIICDYTYRAYEKEVYQEGHDFKHLTRIEILIKDLIEEDNLVARTVLQKYCNLLLRLQGIEKLDRWLLGGLKIGDFMTTEGFLQSIIRSCISRISSSKIAKDCLEDCITTYVYLKEEYELQGKGNYGLYLLIKTQFENTKKELEKINTNETKLGNVIAKQLKSFATENEFNRS